MKDMKHPGREVVASGTFFAGGVWLFGRLDWPLWIRVWGLIFYTGWFAYCLAFAFIKARSYVSDVLDRQ